MIHNVLKFQGHRTNHLGTGTNTARVLALNLAFFSIFCLRSWASPGHKCGPNGFKFDIYLPLTMVHNVLKFQGHKTNHLGTGTNTARVLALNLAIFFFLPLVMRPVHYIRNHDNHGWRPGPNSEAIFRIWWSQNINLLLPQFCGLEFWPHHIPKMDSQFGPGLQGAVNLLLHQFLRLEFWSTHILKMASEF